MTDDLETVRIRLRRFARERDWEQFHTPRNLSLALVGEVGELAAELQWLTDDEIYARLNDSPLRERLADEVADVLIYLVRLADVTGIELVTAVDAKIAKNENRYPAGLAHGRAAKYTQLRKHDAADRGSTEEQEPS